MLDSILHIQITTIILEENQDFTNVTDENSQKLGINMQFLEPTDQLKSLNYEVMCIKYTMRCSQRMWIRSALCFQIVERLK
ncbi:unnamed protein product [Paramecium sonneborni]|uniref:Uncharacterized protein n=1 Tax=Paramecium sonneborni TaxID=65129 RepID=A0A8S1RPA4_9CILI|nr:unnamed protein product [Paramecium sonneborni]